MKLFKEIGAVALFIIMLICLWASCISPKPTQKIENQYLYTDKSVKLLILSAWQNGYANGRLDAQDYYNEVDTTPLLVKYKLSYETCKRRYDSLFK